MHRAMMSSMALLGRGEHRSPELLDRGQGLLDRGEGLLDDPDSSEVSFGSIPANPNPNPNDNPNSNPNIEASFGSISVAADGHTGVSGDVHVPAGRTGGLGLGRGGSLKLAIEEVPVYDA